MTNKPDNFSDRIKILMPLILGLIMGLCIVSLLTSCMTPKRLNRICQLCPVKIERKDSIIIKEVDRPVPYAVPGPSFAVMIDNPCADLCDSLGRLKPFKKEIKTDKGTAVIFTRDNSLHVKCDSDSLHGVIIAKDRIIESYSRAIERVRGCELTHRNWLDYFCRGTSLIFGIIILYKVAKKKYTFLP